MQVKLIGLLFLLALKAYLNWYFLKMCPWEFEKAKMAYVIEQLMTFV